MTEKSRSAIARITRYFRSSPTKEVTTALPEEFAIPLNEFLQSLPSSPGSRLAVFAKEVNDLDILMETVGPVDASLRRTIRTRATVLAMAIRLAEPSWPTINDHRCILTRTHELLRDTPIEGILTPSALSTLSGHAHAAVRFFFDVNDFPNLARALIALANLYRVAGMELKGTQKYLWALHILNERCKTDDSIVARLLHDARCWRLRLRGTKYIDQTDIERELKELSRLVEQGGHPCLRVAHHREMAGFSSYLVNNPEFTMQSLLELQRSRKDLVNHTDFADSTLVTPEIEFLFEHDREDRAKDVIQKRYIPLYLRHRSQYNYERICRWSKTHHFQVAVPPPAYAGALLAYLPRYAELV
jgi:hypothetical protein